MDHSTAPNTPRALWEAFQKTGRISAYLAYCNALRRNQERADGSEE